MLTPYAGVPGTCVACKSQVFVRLMVSQQACTCPLQCSLSARQHVKHFHAVNTQQGHGIDDKWRKNTCPGQITTQSGTSNALFEAHGGILWVRSLCATRPLFSEAGENGLVSPTMHSSR